MNEWKLCNWIGIAGEAADRIQSLRGTTHIGRDDSLAYILYELAALNVSIAQLGALLRRHLDSHT